MSQVIWKVKDCDEPAAVRLHEQTGASPAVCKLLVSRGVKTGSDYDSFMNPSLSQMHDPYLLADMEEGVERLADAIVSGEKICVHGDYDVDGITSTALLVRTLRALKANVDYLLPHRQKDGYDIKPFAIDAAAQRGCSLVVSCDCGINAVSTAERARELGIDLIITDHHDPGAQLPDAAAVINPKRPDSQYPFTGLAGVGVALKLAQGLVRLLGHDDESFVSRFVDLAALGTVADVVPLLDENRTIVKLGLDAIATSKKVGLRTMLRTTGLEGKTMTAHYLAYILGPRINAVGRMDDAAAALQLLLTKDDKEASELASAMERHNSNRKVEQEKILEQTNVQFADRDLASSRILVLSSDGWNPGVIGIVAGKICETYCCPAILIARDESSGMGVGSARSIDAFHMRDALAQCSDLFTHFGGHALAAGFTIPLENIAPFEDRIGTLARESISDEAMVPRIDIDTQLAPEDINRNLADMLMCMEPFGEGNPEPVFMTTGLKVTHKQRVGDGSHLKLKVQGKNGPAIECIAFRMGDLCDGLELGGSIDMCYHVKLNKFNGTESVQLVCKAIR
ncbi:single-stranded-DNA-specific exonuclease RecJ [bacterium]|nr:single-stranded-DNA-specific exonuclease RecJ [bacterium]